MSMGLRQSASAINVTFMKLACRIVKDGCWLGLGRVKDGHSSSYLSPSKCKIRIGSLALCGNTSRVTKQRSYKDEVFPRASV